MFGEYDSDSLVVLIDVISCIGSGDGNGSDVCSVKQPFFFIGTGCENKPDTANEIDTFE